MKLCKQCGIISVQLATLPQRKGAYATATMSLNNRIRAASNFIALIPSHRQILANVSVVEF